MFVILFCFQTFFFFFFAKVLIFLCTNWGIIHSMTAYCDSVLGTVLNSRTTVIHSALVSVWDPNLNPWSTHRARYRSIYNNPCALVVRWEREAGESLEAQGGSGSLAHAVPSIKETLLVRYKVKTSAWDYPLTCAHMLWHKEPPNTYICERTLYPHTNIHTRHSHTPERTNKQQSYGGFVCLKRHIFLLIL